MPVSPSLYEEGTITLVNGSADMTGAGTGWLVNGVAGGTIWVVAGGATQSVPIREISSDGAGKLAVPWGGPNVTDAAYVITREAALAADALFASNALVKVIRDLSLSAVTPVGSGTLTERDAMSPAPAVGAFWLRVEVGHRLDLYRKEAAGWSGPYRFASDGAPGVGAGGYGLPASGMAGQILVKASGDDGDGAWTDLLDVAGPVLNAANHVFAPAGTSLSATTVQAAITEALAAAKHSFVPTGTGLSATTVQAALAQLDAYLATERARGRREILTADRSYYVRADGSNDNDGLANTAARAFLTIQKPVDVVYSTLDLNGYTVTIWVGDGTRAAGVTVAGTPVGARSGNAYPIIIRGNTASPTNCVVNVPGATAFLATNYARLRVEGFLLGTGSAGGAAILASQHSQVAYGNIQFGACAGDQVLAQYFSYVKALTNYPISGSAGGHLHATINSHIDINSITITLVGSISFANYFVGINNANVYCEAATFVGSATGKKFVVHKNGVLDTGGAGGGILPGNVDGTTASGGEVV